MLRPWLLALACAACAPTSVAKSAKTSPPDTPVVASPPAAPAVGPARPGVAGQAIETHVRANANAIVDELVSLLKIPNVASDPADIRRNAAWLVAAFSKRGFSTSIVESPGMPYVVAQRPAPGATTTLLLYMHYDGQPVDPSRWTGHGPFEPVFRAGRLADGAPIIARPEHLTDEHRIYARSASDDKGPIIALLAAVDALDAAAVSPTVNLRVLLEGDEEAGSKHIASLAAAQREQLAADLAIVFDGPSHPGGATVVFGARGLVGVRIEVFGPSAALHSGHYGNWAPNPALRLSQLLASMTDPHTGRVVVEGFYDDRRPLSAVDEAALSRVPLDPTRSPRALGFASPAGPWSDRLEAVTYPSLNVRGLKAAWVGNQTRTIVPDVAIAELDLRLVEDIEPDQQVARLTAHVRAQGYHVLGQDIEPTAALRREHPRLCRITRTGSAYPAARTPMDLPRAKALVDRLTTTFGRRPVMIPTLGGSVPIYAFQDIVGAPPLVVPVVNPDNNQHAPNENLRMGHLWAAMRTMAAIVTMPEAVATR